MVEIPDCPEIHAECMWRYTVNCCAKSWIEYIVANFTARVWKRTNYGVKSVSPRIGNCAIATVLLTEVHWSRLYRLSQNERVQ